MIEIVETGNSAGINALEKYAKFSWSYLFPHMLFIGILNWNIFLEMWMHIKHFPVQIQQYKH